MTSKTESKRPRWFSNPEVAKVGVEIIQRTPSPRLKCRACGQVWQPHLRTGGRLPRGYWRCPEGCNA